MRTTSDGRDLDAVAPERAHIERVERSLRVQSSIAKTALADLRGALQRAEAAENVTVNQHAQERALRSQLEQVQHELRLVASLYAAIEQSNSWRLTLPLRLLGKAVRGKMRSGAALPFAVEPPGADNPPASSDATSVAPQADAPIPPGTAEAIEAMRVAARRWSPGKRR